MEEKSGEVEVGCAIIFHDSRLLIAQRLPGTHLGGFWEFPGGKRHAGETLENCLVREAAEELGIEIVPRECIRTVRHVYPARTLKLFFYTCAYVRGRPVRKECLDFAWVSPEELHGYRFPPADRDVITDLIRKQRYYFRKGPFI